MAEESVVVTGGASGLGKAICLKLASSGSRVAILDINADLAKATADEIGRAGGKATVAIGDITTRDGAADAFAEAAATLGSVTGLVNCAGVYARKPILDISDADWEFNFSVNVRGLYNVSVAAIRHMKTAGRGRIVNVASIDALKAHPSNAHYAATKAAVVSLTKSMGLYCAPDGILINGVAPAAIATDHAKAAGFLPELAAQTPIGHAAEPDDIAEVVSFLLSDKNRYMVGETVAISGGYFVA